MGLSTRATGAYTYTLDEVEVRQGGALRREPLRKPPQRLPRLPVIDPTDVDTRSAQLAARIRRWLRRENHGRRNRLLLEALRHRDQLLLAGAALLRVQMQDDPDAAAQCPLRVRRP